MLASWTPRWRRDGQLQPGCCSEISVPSKSFDDLRTKMSLNERLAAGILPHYGSTATTK